MDPDFEALIYVTNGNDPVHKTHVMEVGPTIGK